MTLITIPNRPAGSAQRSIEQILANFDAVTAVVNGNLDGTNMGPTSGVEALTWRGTGTATLNPGDLAYNNTSGPVTYTLPAPTNNAVVGIQGVLTNLVTVQYGSGGGSIYLEDQIVSSFVLGTYRTVKLKADGTNWNLLSGQADSGPITLVNQPSITGTAYARKVGSKLYLSGALTNNTGGAINYPTIIAVIPASVAPSGNLFGLASVPQNLLAPTSVVATPGGVTVGGSWPAGDGLQFLGLVT